MQSFSGFDKSGELRMENGEWRNRLGQGLRLGNK